MALLDPQTWSGSIFSGGWREAAGGDRPVTEPAAVLRRAAALMAADAEEIQGWIVRETGGIPPKAALETDIAGAELDEAAALASAPYGELLRSHEPRLSMARRVPAGVVGVISPFNFPLISRRARRRRRWRWAARWCSSPTRARRSRDGLSLGVIHQGL